ncbi:MAG: sulfite oxidase [Alphaproteobacteria bacterium]|nr:sulfite oxidase [Alphaproteobacteria bacterium]
MTKQREIGIRELYQQDPVRADELVFGRRAGPNRRGFLRGAGLAAMSAAVGAAIPFHRNMPAGLIPAALAESKDDFKLEGKDGLSVLNDRPVNAETPAHLLDDAITPISRHFVRNNGLVPDRARSMEAGDWTLTIDGEVATPLTLTLDEIKKKFKPVTHQLQIECGGNGRAAFNPPAKGNQWTVGAIGCSEWTGVPMRDLFKAAGIKDSAVYTGYYGEDVHLSGKPDKVVISRGAPIAKMMEPHTLLAYQMNGQDIPFWHGFPARIVAPGWPGSVSGKWVKRIWIRKEVHDGPKMTGTSYRVPWFPPEPGEKVEKKDWRIIESMPVKSLITFPETGTTVTGKTLDVRGHAWAGDNAVKRLDLTMDFGASWVEAKLEKPKNPYAWQHWQAELTFPSKGYYEIWARATDDKGRMQPFAVTWNGKGYLNNSMHRVAVKVVV